MKEVKIPVPYEIDYLSKWETFDSTLPQGKVILNKNICGCGCTEYYLCNDMPVILVSPRKELLHCKMESERDRPLFYFDRSKSRTVKLDETKEQLRKYVCNPFSQQGFVPKILVTYDSLTAVIDTLKEMDCFDRFTIVVDEFTCIFTDVLLKGFVELNLIHMLNQTPNHVVYISATPINNAYLDEVDEFKNIPYVSLVWDPKRYETVTTNWQKMINTRKAIIGIIEGFRKDSYFMAKLIEGRNVYSKEAIFFLNSVNDIVAVINSCGLTLDDTLVICADDPKNREKLNKVGFTIGHVTNKRDYKKKNKPFTFVTKASFEGADFYSDCSTTYVFADSNRDNLALDISIDLPQIIGRCRTRENPFRNIVNYYFKTTSTEKFDVEETKKRIDEKMDATERLVEQYKDIHDIDALRKLSTAQLIEHYRKDYVEMKIMGNRTAKAVCNKLAWVADLRAIEIKSMQYKTTYSVLSRLESNMYQTENYHSTANDELASFYNEFYLDNNFQRRMKLYAETIGKYPEMKPRIEELAEIPLKYKNYYNVLGEGELKALSYKEADIIRQIRWLQSEDNIRKCLKEHVKSGENYSNAEAKELIRRVYEELGLPQTPKASSLPLLIDAEEVRFTDVNGDRQRGYKIL